MRCMYASCTEGGNTSPGIRVLYSKRSPAVPLTGADADKLLVAMFAWDGNAYPGNEFWMNSLSASGDPAAACCSTVGELGNADVNPERVCGAAVRWF